MRVKTSVHTELNGSQPGLPTNQSSIARVEFTQVWMFSDPSTLGTVYYSSGKSVKLTRLRQIGQIMWPESRNEIP